MFEIIPVASSTVARHHECEGRAILIPIGNPVIACLEAIERPPIPNPS